MLGVAVVVVVGVVVDDGCVAGCGAFGDDGGCRCCRVLKRRSPQQQQQSYSAC